MYEAFKRFLPLQPQDLPEPLRDELVKLKEAISWLPPEEEEGQGTALATINAMSEEEAEFLAHKIFELYLRIEDFSR